MSSSELVVSDRKNGELVAAAQKAEEQEDLPVDLSQLPHIPMSKTLLLVTNFVSNTTRFLNHFANECEERIGKVSSDLTRVEILLAILEAKLNSVSDLDVTDKDVEAAGRTMRGEGPSAADEVDIGIDDADLPSADADVNPPPPPPPPESEMGDFDSESNALVVPPPPPSGPPTDDEDNDYLAIEPVEEESGSDSSDEEDEDNSSVVKLKDDPLYAKYFTMRRLGIPEQAIQDKLKMDGLDPSILTMDPDGPSPSGATTTNDGGEGGPVLPIAAPPPPSDTASEMSDDNQPRTSVESGNIGMPFPPPPPPDSPTSSVTSSQRGAASLFGDGAPPPPPPPPLPEGSESDSDDSSDSSSEEEASHHEGYKEPSEDEDTGGVMKLKDDPAYEKYFKMRKLGMPDGAIQQKMMLDGVTEDILNMDPEGPSPNAQGGTASSSTAPPSGGLPPPPKRQEDSDDDFDSD